MTARRFYVVGAKLAPVGYDSEDIALKVAREMGEGTAVVDTQATPYHPMVRRIQNGEPMFDAVGAWPTRRAPEQNLIEAAKTGSSAIVAAFVAAFVAAGLDVNARDANGATALIWAVARRVPDCVKLLLAAGADASARDHKGKSALDLASAKGQDAIAALLRGAGPGNHC
ncbi:MAG: ankyrin repeat domain-containing protein [Alphaproteobacteria bacterium]|nr:ankyrin repeat domain-containing protein [Alphaproteobacteria bacterium]